MRAVPFENLDITLGYPIALSVDSFLDKIVNRRRGGFCYELNSAFAWLLRELGFSVKFLTARVFKDEVPGPEFSHLLLQIKVEQTVIGDVGFGDSFLLPLVPGEHPCYQLDRFYQVIKENDLWTMRQKRHDDSWEPRYIFDMKPYQLDDFSTMCAYHQNSDMSIFTRSTVCSRATRQGRVTYTNGRLILNDGIDRQETVVEDKKSLRDILQNHFDVYLSELEIESLIAATDAQISFD